MVKLKTFVMMLVFGAILLYGLSLASAAAVTVTTFNDSSSSGGQNMTGVDYILKYVSIPSGTLFTNAYLTLTGAIDDDFYVNTNTGSGYSGSAFTFYTRNGQIFNVSNMMLDQAGFDVYCSGGYWIVTGKH